MKSPFIEEMDIWPINGIPGASKSTVGKATHERILICNRGENNQSEEETMAVKPPIDPKRMLADKRALQQAMAELNARRGFVPDPDATPEKVRAMMRSDGIRPEDNAFSREIIRMRHEE